MFLNTIKYFFLLICFMFALSHCTGPSSTDSSGDITITNRSPDLFVQVSLGSSEKELKKDMCVRVKRNDFQGIRISYKPEILTPYWYEICSNKNCMGAKLWLEICQGSNCNQSGFHYEFQGSLKSEKKWVATQTAPSNCSEY